MFDRHRISPALKRIALLYLLAEPTVPQGPEQQVLVDEGEVLVAPRARVLVDAPLEVRARLPHSSRKMSTVELSSYSPR